VTLGTIKIFSNPAESRFGGAGVSPVILQVFTRRKSNGETPALPKHRDALLNIVVPIFSSTFQSEKSNPGNRSHLQTKRDSSLRSE
jgi:hypothetical protein